MKILGWVCLAYLEFCAKWIEWRLYRLNKTREVTDG